ncbi:hypothetical protein M9Y10_041419 [Tritrichomonas musculus]|uniref:Uncharacterized protein n=1 Tax=Tritrichomonas musculus TaxID=1915356 RepID=A0ABR2K496_9EUKA
MFFSTKNQGQRTPKKKIDYAPFLRLSEVERSNSGDITLVSSTKISFHFSMLLDPLKCYHSIQCLNKIAQTQRFSVIKKYYDNIFIMIKNANSISETLRLRLPNQPILPPSEIINQCLSLIDKIASFSPFFLMKEEIRPKHITFLYNLLPNETAFKALGKLLVLNIDFAKHIINLGIDKIASKITELNLPLFIWFLGSFAYFPDLSQYMLPYYEEYIVKNSVSQNEFIRKFCYDALAILVKYSSEMCVWISSSPIINTIFTISPTSAACAKKYIELADDFLTIGMTSFLKEENTVNTLISVLQMCFTDSFGLAMIASKVLISLVRLGFLSILISSRIDDALFKFVFGDASFKEKEAAMKILCVLFISSPKQTKIRYLSLRFTDIVSDAIELGDSELHSYGVTSLHHLIIISNEEDDYETLKISIQEMLDMLSLEEYDQIIPPCA